MISSAIVAIALCTVVCIGYVDASCCDSCPLYLPSSCEEIQAKIHQSGYYAIASGGDIKSIYCSAEELCGSTGWTRVGIADFGNPQTPCPDGLIEHNDNEVRACKRESLSSVIIPTNGISYSQVCGTVQGYQFGSPDGFFPKNTGPKNIEENYLDGISVTHGPSGSRQHIFSFAGATGTAACPCYENSKLDSTPSFVGQDYYCESGIPSGEKWSPIVYGNDILWDGQQCPGSEAPCCSASPHMPYFHKELDLPTTDDIELRILSNQNIKTDEDILLLSYEIYIK